MRGSKWLGWGLCLFGATAWITGSALSQDAEPSEAVKNGMKAYQAIFAQAGKPAEQHAWLAKLDGDWTGASKTWTTFTTKDKPLTASWTRSAKLEMNGLFLTDTVSGSFVGADFHGAGTLGYDKDAKQFFAVTRSNLGTGVIVYRGTLDDEGKVLTLVSDEQNRMGMKFTMKEVLTVVSDDHWNLQMISVYPGGMEVKEVEIDWKRAP